MNTTTPISPTPPEATILDQTFEVEGMSCSGCASTVLKTVASLGGVRSASVDLHKAKVHVEYDASQIDASSMKIAVDALGYSFVLPAVAG